MGRETSSTSWYVFSRITMIPVFRVDWITTFSERLTMGMGRPR